jgi:hypothetical protein
MDPCGQAAQKPVDLQLGLFLRLFLNRHRRTCERDSEGGSKSTMAPMRARSLLLLVVIPLRRRDLWVTRVPLAHLVGVDVFLKSSPPGIRRPGEVFRESGLCQRLTTTGKNRAGLRVPFFNSGKLSSSILDLR